MAPDRITNLPCGVLEDIFVRLPLCDVVRTSILSKEWRYKWASIPHLVFDYDFANSLHHGFPETVIFYMLLSHRGSLVKFSLSRIEIKCSLSIDHWLNLLASHHIEDLTLHVSSGPHYKIPHVLFGFNHLKKLSLQRVDIKLPPTFQGFSGLLQLSLHNVIVDPVELHRFISKSPKLELLGIIYCDPSILQFLGPQTPYETPSNFLDNLTHFSVRGTDIDLPHTFQGFIGLVKLDIMNARISPAHLQTLLSKCPMLEFLSINLLDDYTFYDLIINAPKLKVLYLVGLFNSIILNTTSLEELSIEYGDCSHVWRHYYSSDDDRCGYFDRVEFPESKEGGSNLIKVLGHLSSLRKLEGGLFFLQFMAVGGVPHMLPYELNHLTHLSLKHINFGILDNVTSTLCLMRSSPNLESLNISFASSNSCMWPKGMTPQNKYQQSRKIVASLKSAARKKCGITLTHLKDVTIKRFCGCKPEMEFVRFLLVMVAGNGINKFEVRFSDIDTAMNTNDELEAFNKALPQRVPLKLSL